MGLFDIFKKKNKEEIQKEQEEQLQEGLSKTKQGFFSKISRAIIGKSTIDDEVLDNLEEILVSSDVGVDTTLKIIKRIQERVKRDKYINTTELNTLLKEEIAALMMENKTEDVHDFIIPAHVKKPYIILVVGVNGVGKTTTIGKLALQFKLNGHTVLLGAGDTFRAAAVDQLKIWAERVEVPIVDLGMNIEPSTVAYKTVEKGIEMGVDVVIIDTAGRLQTKKGLMDELSKIRRTIQKFADKIQPDIPHEVLLVLDASTGQNAIQQAIAFTEATQVSAIALTKLDGTAKGGIVIGISDQFKIPVKYIGVGEKATDLQVFNRKKFVEALFKGTELTK
ncbi:MAG: signal recognition particle-docking protein FtsY [Bacteroidia bacterium]|nr:signal recognition particle-docking protein FtsY [Bacteroidia bacterium]MDW8347543.1 signal recognition particle-docking protein FtsY [Bacteroidia bacterium]